MLRIFQSLGRLSVRGYLVIAGLVALTVLLNYSSWQNQLHIAAREAQKHAGEHAAGNETLSLSEANSATPSPASTGGGTTPATTPQTFPTVATNAGAVQAARTLSGGNLVFSPANITLSLGATAPLVTISAPDGATITSPVLRGDPTGALELKPKNSPSGAKTAWPMQLTGKPVPGTYQLQVRAIATKGTDTVEYIGTLTVVIIL